MPLRLRNSPPPPPCCLARGSHRGIRVRASSSWSRFQVAIRDFGTRGAASNGANHSNWGEMQRPPHVPILYCIPSRLICTRTLHKTMHPSPRRRAISGKMMGDSGSPGLSVGPDLFMGHRGWHNLQPYACLTCRQPVESLGIKSGNPGANRFRARHDSIHAHRHVQLHLPTANKNSFDPLTNFGKVCCLVLLCQCACSRYPAIFSGRGGA